MHVSYGQTYTSVRYGKFTTINEGIPKEMKKLIIIKNSSIECI